MVASVSHFCSRMMVSKPRMPADTTTADDADEVEDLGGVAAAEAELLEHRRRARACRSTTSAISQPTSSS